jgi:phenylalanyl-tRNA synthetase beta chain
VLTAGPSSRPEFIAGRGSELLVDGQRLGWLGEISEEIRRQLDLHDPVTVCELDLTVLEGIADFFPAYEPIPETQGSDRDLNFVLDEAITWQELEEVVKNAGGPLLTSVAFVGQFRGQQIPADKKSYIVRLNYRASDRTLTSEEIDAAQTAVVTACRERLAAVQR